MYNDQVIVAKPSLSCTLYSGVKLELQPEEPMFSVVAPSDTAEDLLLYPKDLSMKKQQVKRNFRINYLKVEVTSPLEVFVSLRINSSRFFLVRGF